MTIILVFRLLCRWSSVVSHGNRALVGEEGVAQGQEEEEQFGDEGEIVREP